MKVLWHTFTTWLLIFSINLPVVHAVIQSIPYPQEYFNCLIERSHGFTPQNVTGEEICSFCINQFLWVKSPDINNYEISDQIMEFIREMFVKAQGAGLDTEDKNLRVRKEYRMLTRKERDDYHRAVQLLKDDKSVLPNRYDAIADFHRGSAVQSAHYGAAFLPWHRICLLVYEEALRKKVPGVTVPYWDITLDNELKNPVDSVMFTEKFFGNPDGPVKTGPFANWKHDLGGDLVRNAGLYGELMSKQNVQDVLSRKYHYEITDRQSGGLKYNIEELHAKVHIFVGGNMARLSTATRDPIFYSYHAFIDCVWEQFRKQQEAEGIDPSKDYPYTSDPLHHPFRKMDGFRSVLSNDFVVLPSNASFVPRDFRNIDGFSNNFTRDIYSCDDFPSCSKEHPTCDSRWLDCNTDTYRCIPKTKEADLDRLDATPVVMKTVQNTFEVNGKAETDSWVYITVQIVFERPPSLKFNSFPVHRGSTETKCDVFCDNKTETGQNSRTVLKTYDRHTVIDSGFEKVYVNSDGINYDGQATEYAILDQRFALSEGVAYVPVRKPTAAKKTEVVLTAFDSGGRLCRPFCKGLDGKFSACTGCLSIDTNEPRMYRPSYADVVLGRWDFERGCPLSNNDDVYIKFFCDFLDVWPWQQHDAYEYSMSIKANIEKHRREKRSQWQKYDLHPK